jgi:hypothetical protein
MEVQARRATLLELDQRVQLGLAAGVLLIAFGILALPWVEFDQALGGGVSYGFDDLRRAFGDVDGNDRFLGNLLIWIAAGFFGLGYGIASLTPADPAKAKSEEQFLPAIPLALCLLMLWRINHFITDAAGAFILSGVDARLGSGGVMTTCGCAVVLGSVVWGHQLASSAEPAN